MNNRALSNLSLRPALLLSGLLLGSAFAATPGEAATLTIQTIDAQTGDPVAGAWVMIGESEGSPFAGNIGTTDGSGLVTFDDPVLDNAQTATAAASGYGLTSLYRSATGSVTLRLYPTTFDPTFGGSLNELSGNVSNVSTVSNDGNLDATVILPGLTTETLAFFDPEPFFFENVPVDFPVVGEVMLPENVYITPQVEFVFLVFEKEPWTLDVPGNRTSNFVALSGRADIGELSNDPDLNAITIREVGIERDVVLGSGSQSFNINSDIDLDSDGLTANFSGVPAGSQLRVVSAALIGSGVDEELLGFSTLTPNIDEGTSWSVPGTNPTGDIADASMCLAAVYGDPSVASAYDIGIFERGPLAVPSSTTFDSWMEQAVLTQDGAALLWEDPTNDGVSPSPVWSRSTLGLQPVDPEDTATPVTAEWRIYAPASAGAIELPSIPVSAPSGLSNPDDTAENDQLYWNWVAANNSADVNEAMDNFMYQASHWTQARIPLDLDPASAPTPDLASKLQFTVVPSPMTASARITWGAGTAVSGLSEAGENSAGPNGAMSQDGGFGWDDASRAIDLRIVGANGRTVRRFGPQLENGELLWDGRDGRGREVPAGVYFVIAQSGRKIVAHQQIVRMR